MHLALVTFNLSLIVLQIYMFLWSGRKHSYLERELYESMYSIYYEYGATI